MLFEAKSISGYIDHHWIRSFLNINVISEITLSQNGLIVTSHVAHPTYSHQDISRRIQKEGKMLFIPVWCILNHQSQSLGEKDLDPWPFWRLLLFSPLSFEKHGINRMLGLLTMCPVRSCTITRSRIVNGHSINYRSSHRTIKILSKNDRDSHKKWPKDDRWTARLGDCASSPRVRTTSSWMVSSAILFMWR